MGRKEGKRKVEEERREEKKEKEEEGRKALWIGLVN